MRPDDANGRLATAARPLRVVVIAGSDRRQYNCPGVDSKARMLMFRMADALPGKAYDWYVANAAHVIVRTVAAPGTLVAHSTE